MDDPGKDVVAQDGSHRVEHKHQILAQSEREGSLGAETKEQQQQHYINQQPNYKEEKIRTIPQDREGIPGQTNVSYPHPLVDASSTANVRQRHQFKEEDSGHWGSKAAEMEGAPQQVRTENSGSWAHQTEKAPGRIQQIREHLSPYGQRLKEDVTSSIRNAPQRAKETVVRAGRNTVQYADQRTDSMMDSFAFDPLGQIQQGRQIRQHQKEKLIMIREQQAEGTRAVPTPRHPRRELAQSGLNLLNEGFAPAPIMGFDAIRGSRATGRKRKRDVGPGDLLL